MERFQKNYSPIRSDWRNCRGFQAKKNTRKRIKFDTAVDKGKETEYTVLLSCKQNGKAPEPFLSSLSAHRVDELLLRVVFPANLLPDQVVYILRNADKVEVHRETIKERDRLTGEFRKLIKYAEPHMEHVLEWQSISKN